MKKPKPVAAPSRRSHDRGRIAWRQVDATTEAEIAQQAAADPDTAPVLSADALRAAGRRIAPTWPGRVGVPARIQG